MLLTLLNSLLVILEVLFFFNLLIVVHEFGHFLAARWRGRQPRVTLIIEEFGVWFGKPLWRRKFNGVWYSFGCIPLGGFVKLPQLGNQAIEGKSEYETNPNLEGGPDYVHEEVTYNEKTHKWEAKRELPRLKPLDRIIIAVAGPLFSFLLALALACVVWAIGKPSSQPDSTTEIGTVLAGGPAAKAGLKPGDKILAIDGKPVTRFSGPVSSVMWGIISSEGDQIDFLIERGGQPQHILSGWEKEEGSGWARKPKRRVKIGPRVIPEIAALEANGPGAAAGLKVGDVVTEVNGTPVITLDQVATILEKAPGETFTVTAQRGPAPFRTTVAPRPVKKGEEKLGPDLGIEWGRFFVEHPAPWQQIVDSVHSIRNMLGALASRKSDVKLQDFSGPVGIMNMYRRILSSDEGWRLAISFSVLFNVNLAIINLLPLPLLDGGHIMFGLIELVRRKPGNAKVLEILETACLFTIIGYVLYVTYFDVADFFPSRHKAALATPAPATPAPQP